MHMRPVRKFFVDKIDAFSIKSVVLRFMKMRHLHILFLVLAFLLSGLTHSVKAEVASKEKKGDKKATQELVIKAQTDALMPFSFAVDVLAPTDFFVLPVYSDAAVNTSSPSSNTSI